MDVIAAYESVGTYRGAAEICGTTHKTVRRIVEAHQAEQSGASPVERKETGPQLRPGGRAGHAAGEGDAGADLGEAVAAGGPSRRL